MKWMAAHPEDVVQALRLYYGPKNYNLESLASEKIPEKIHGFHDPSYLFACHQANRGIIAQDFDEASYIWKIIAERKPAQLIEIGRWLGGSTILHAAVSNLYGGQLTSVDLKVKMPTYAKDELIERHLERLNLDNVLMVIGNSREYQPQSRIQYAFIDGDHSYEGVRADFENIVQYMYVDADMLFHDACATRAFATKHEPVARFIEELKMDPRVVWIEDVGSISDFRVKAGNVQSCEKS